MLKKYQLRSYNIRLVIALLITSGFGIIVINSANSTYTIRQCIGLAISLFLMAAVSFIDYNWILKYYWLIYIVNLAALLAVKQFGHESHGAKRWIKVPLIGQFQPSEFTKLLLILFTVKLLCMYKDKINDWRFLTILAILLAIPLAFILKQPNLSTTLLTFLILFTVIFCAGLSYKIIGIALLIIVPVVSGFMIYISNPDNKVFFIQDYQRTRIMAFLNSDANEYDDSNYQQEYAERAIGSGQLSGKGLNNDDPSSLKNAHYIAEAQNDFIFAVIGEELGFVGGCITILLLSWIVIECIIVAVTAKDFAGRLICCGVSAYIGFQTFINIGVVTRLLPNTGLPLPFFSYGLTSLFSLFISMGVVLNVSLQRKVERDDDIFADDFKG